MLADEIDARFDSGDEADFYLKPSRGFRSSRLIGTASYSESAVVDEELRAAREDLEAMELRELMAAKDASRGIAHAVLRATLRHALITRCARALDRWRAYSMATPIGVLMLEQTKAVAAIPAAADHARLEHSVIRREMGGALREAEAEAHEAAIRAVRVTRRESAAAEACARREADRGRREAQAARGEAEEARREASSLSKQLVVALAQNAKREAEGAAREGESLACSAEGCQIAGSCVF